MSLFELSALLLSIAAICGWINHRWLNLPTTIGLMAITSVCSSRHAWFGVDGI